MSMPSLLTTISMQYLQIYAKSKPKAEEKLWTCRESPVEQHVGADEQEILA